VDTLRKERSWRQMERKDGKLGEEGQSSFILISKIK